MGKRWKIEIVAYYNVLSRQLFGRTEKSRKEVHL
jgi:hypothetical protein